MQATFLKPVGQAVAKGERENRPSCVAIGEFEFDLIGFLGRDLPGSFSGKSMGRHWMVLASPGVMVVGAGDVVVAHDWKEQGAARPHLSGVSSNDCVVVMQSFHEAMPGEGSLVSDEPPTQLGQHLGHGSGLIPDFYAST